MTVGPFWSMVLAVCFSAHAGYCALNEDKSVKSGCEKLQPGSRFDLALALCGDVELMLRRVVRLLLIGKILRTGNSLLARRY